MHKWIYQSLHTRISSKSLGTCHMAYNEFGRPLVNTPRSALNPLYDGSLYLLTRNWCDLRSHVSLAFFHKGPVVTFNLFTTSFVEPAWMGFMWLPVRVRSFWWTWPPWPSFGMTSTRHHFMNQGKCSESITWNSSPVQVPRGWKEWKSCFLFGVAVNFINQSLLRMPVHAFLLYSWPVCLFCVFACCRSPGSVLPLCIIA